jgi:hypothetical protein
MNMKKFYEVFIIAVIFFIICFVYKGQQRISLNGGRGWDGINYYSLTEQIQQGAKPIVGEFPFTKRLGTPFLTAQFSKLLGTDIMDSALYVNLLGSFITVILLLFWLKIFIPEFWIRSLLCFLFMMVWYVLIRYSFYYPLTSDAWGAPWFIGGLILLEEIRKSYSNGNYKSFLIYLLIYALVITTGNLFRESNALLSLLPLFIINPIKNIRISSDSMTISNGINYLRKTSKLYFSRFTILLFFPAVFLKLTNLAVDKFIVTSHSNDYSYLTTAIFWLYTKSLPEYILAIFIAFGPLILLAPFYFKKYRMVFWEREELLVVLILALMLGLIGGSDSERILFMAGFPVVFMIMGISILSIYNSSQRWWLYILFLLQSVSYRFFWTLPDLGTEKLHSQVPFFSIPSNNFPYLDLYSRFGDYKVHAILFAEYLLLLIITWYVIYNKVVIKSGNAIKK